MSERMAYVTKEFHAIGQVGDEIGPDYVLIGLSDEVSCQNIIIFSNFLW